MNAAKYLIGLAATGTLFFSSVLFINKNTTTDNPSEEIFSVETSAKKFSEFDPNELTQEEWQELGFSEKQAATILKYKKVVGGSFSSKEQLKKCYSISDEKFSELEPYILLPEKAREEKNYSKPAAFYSNNSYSKSNSKTLNISRKFNPDHFTQDDFMNLGFTEKQSAAILKYKNYLGGSFQSKEKFRECFVISEENYQRMEPFLLLPETAPEQTSNGNKTFRKSESSKIRYEDFDPNILDAQGWKNLGFSEKQAQVIINYRDKRLKGSFKSLEDIQNCFVISEEKFNEMLPYIKLSAEKSAKASSNEKESAVAADYSKIDLNEITFKQLQQFGFDEKAAGSFIGFRKKLGGFVNTEQMLETYNIDRELMKDLISKAKFNTEMVEKYSLTDAPESWLKSHPYFKYYADKIIYFRITYPDDRKIMRKINAKPEAELKMKLYLK